MVYQKRIKSLPMKGSTQQFADILQRHLERGSYTPGRLSKLTGIPRATIINWLNRRVLRPRYWQDLLKVAQILELDRGQANELLQAAHFPSLSNLLDQNREDPRLEYWFDRPADPGESQAAEAKQDPLIASKLRPYRHLPAIDYQEVFGRSEFCQRVVDLLEPDGKWRMVSLEGIGGIGKTTAARQVAATLAATSYFSDILWVSARQEQFHLPGQIAPVPQPIKSLTDIVNKLIEQLGLQRLAGMTTPDKLAHLQHVFNSRPYLIIVDNLETLADSQELLPALHGLSETSHFLLTSRQSLSDFQPIFAVPVPLLTLADSHQLLNQEFARHGRLHSFSEEQSRAVFELTGGLPLALKLVAAQLSYMPFADVLANLRAPSRTSQAQLYTYIYRQSWQRLSLHAKQLLLSILDVSADGETPTWIQSMCGLPHADFYLALKEVLDYSLLEVSGSLAEPVYRLHRMTATFLQTEILNEWQ